MAEPYSAADFRHGSVAITAPGFPALAGVPGSAIYADVVALFPALVEEPGNHLVALSDEEEVLAVAPARRCGYRTACSSGLFRSRQSSPPV